MPTSAQPTKRYAERLASLVGDLPTVILVRAAGAFAGRLLDSGADAGTDDRRPRAGD